MKAKEFIIMYWIAIVIDCVVIELSWFLPDPNLGINEMNVWFIGFIGRVLLYILVACWGCLGLINLLEMYKIK